MDIVGTLSAAVWTRIERLLEIIAGDPAQAERCVLTSAPVSVTDTAITVIDRAQDRSQAFSTAVLTFTSSSGSGRRTLDGTLPTATGTQGIQIPSGGGVLTLRGAENIRAFKVVAETGQAMSFTAELFQAAGFPGEVR